MEVGIGVGYLEEACSRLAAGERACLLEGRGNAGDEVKTGSKAGSKVAMERLVPAWAGKGDWEFILLGEESMRADIDQRSWREADSAT